MKKTIQIVSIVLGLVIIGLVYLLIRQFTVPMNFSNEMKGRESAVINKIVDIRSAEQSFKAHYQRYTGSFDSLIEFVLTDSLEFERRIGSADDSVAVAHGMVSTEKFKVAVIDTVFYPRKYTPEMVRNIRYIPYSELEYGTPQEFILAAGLFETESGVIVPVFECKAPYKLFLGDLNRQELINLIDERQNTMGRYPGIAVGALDRATNDAGNWE